MKKIPVLLLLTAIFAASQNIKAFCSGAGTSGGQFLKIGVDSRSSALGGTAATSQGAGSIFLNPAGLCWVDDMEIYFSQISWMEDINYSNMAFAKNEPYGVFGLGVNYLSMPSITEVDNTGTKLAESFIPSDMCVTLSYGNFFDNGIDFGGSVKFIQSKIAERSASAFALDAGAKKKLGKCRTEIGVLIQNFGSEMKFNAVGDPLPLTFKFGGKYVLPFDGFINLDTFEIKNGINFLTDLSYVNDSGYYTDLGAEYVKMTGNVTIMGRLGYKTGFKGLDSTAGFSCGFGLSYKQYTLDYALALFGELGQTHRITFSVKL
jgi:hypothetical protein